MSQSAYNERTRELLIKQYRSYPNMKEDDVFKYIFQSSFGCEHLARHDEDLEKLLTEEQKAIFEKYQDCWNEYVSLAEAAIFEYAFRLGARLTYETMFDNQLNA